MLFERFIACFCIFANYNDPKCTFSMRLLTLLSLFWIPLINVSAQMTLTLNGVNYSSVAQRDSKGFTTVTLPAGANLSGLITAVSVDGQTVLRNR